VITSFEYAITLVSRGAEVQHNVRLCPRTSGLS
jgi:hypothetical protein